ncbi:MAG: 50S ribosomal protein L31e [Candidatus Bathyarchaeia archaeon]
MAKEVVEEQKKAEEEPVLTEEEPALEPAEEAVTAEEVPAEEKPTEEIAEKVTKKKKAEEEIVEERTYTVPLSRALVRPPKKRAPRAMQLLKIFITKHMKLEMKVSEEEEEEELPQLIISQEVNEKIWDKGIEKPPRKIRVRAAKDKDGKVTVYLAEAQ